MAALTTLNIPLAGVAPSYAAAAAGGDTFLPTNNTFLHVKNASGSAITVTIVTPGSVQGQAVADTAVSVPATTGERLIGPMRADLYARTSDGRADITYSAATSVTIGVFELDPSVA